LLVHRRFCLLLAALSLGTAAPAGASLQVGISEQSPNVFANPWFAKLGIEHARIVVPWNILRRDDWWPDYLRAWLDGAREAGVTPHVAFGIADLVPSQYGRGPTLRQYRALIRGFRRAYPQVRTFTPWNEANHVFQPTARRPKLAWQYYRILRAACPTCTVRAADVADLGNLESWLRGFLRHHHGRAVWGLHNYQDANQHRTLSRSSTLQMAKLVRGPIWSSEAGGIVGYRSVDKGDGYRFDLKRQLSAQRHLFKLLAHPRVRNRYPRLYLHNFFGTWSQRTTPDRWDSGLLGADGKPRPSYWDLKARLGALSG
jgi:hypothetical protein